MAGCGVGVHHQIVRVLVPMVIPRTNQLAIAAPSRALVRGDSRGLVQCVEVGGLVVCIQLGEVSLMAESQWLSSQRLPIRLDLGCLIPSVLPNQLRPGSPDVEHG